MTIPHVGTPTAGFYQMRLVKGGPWVPVHIWHGAPLDPVTGEELERGHRWQAIVNGELVTGDAVLDAWIGAAGNPIAEWEYDYMLAMIDHATRYEPAMPEANPRQKIDWSKLTFDFGKAPT